MLRLGSEWRRRGAEAERGSLSPVENFRTNSSSWASVSVVTSDSESPVGRNVTLNVPEAVEAWLKRRGLGLDDGAAKEALSRALALGLDQLDQEGADLAGAVVQSALGFAIITTDPDGLITTWSPGQ